MQIWARYDSWRRRLALGLIAGLAVLAILNVLFPPSLAALGQRSTVVEDRHGRLLSAFTVDNGRWRLGAELDNIDPRFIKRLIAIEDKRFFEHSGVDPLAVMRAMRSWANYGEVVSGASTLTMQLVRQAEPRSHTLPSKVIEALRAAQLELWLNKDEILSAYLSHVSYGGNIEGIEAASRLYLGKSPEFLTDGEIALLISLPQAPEARRPDRNAASAKAGRDIILRKLGAAGVMTETAVIEAINSPISAQRKAMPDTAWITAKGIGQNQEDATRSTLDYGLQKKVEARVASVIEDLPQDVTIAVTVVENATMAVRAHIASADRGRPGGWLDLTVRSRSPGSTLKPFIYGLAIDEGSLSASSIAYDAPTRFGAYRPENFNGRYHGHVRVSEALRHSLNVPAVAALEMVGGERFEQSLIASGADVTRLGQTSDKAGLALALGGVGLSVNDVAMLYAALANGGEARPLRWVEDEEADGAMPVPLMSEKAARDITQILSQAPIPDGHMPSWLREGGTSIAYKTGTSYGFRDAWAAGYTDDYTVVIWSGRADGAPRIGATGRISAAPLLFDIFDQLPSQKRAHFYRKDTAAPGGLKTLSQTRSNAPHILFPPDGSEVFANALGRDARGFTLSVRTEDGAYTAFINGEPIEKTGRHYVWRPKTAGFYKLTVVDRKGREATSKIRVLSPKALEASSSAFNQFINTTF